jgi:flagellar protein FlaG
MEDEMRVEAVSLAGSATTKTEMPAEVDHKIRKQVVEGKEVAAESKDRPRTVQPEEILDKIKALTQDGAYSVRFEMHAKTRQLVARLVDAESGEVIRQLPPEEMLELAVKLEKLTGNIINSHS